jgi:hypothetical protein
MSPRAKKEVVEEAVVAPETSVTAAAPAATEECDCEGECEYCYVIYSKPKLQFVKTTGGRKWYYQTPSRKATHKNQ